MKMKKCLIFIGCLFLAVVILTGCSGGKTEPQTLKIGMLPIEDNIPLYIAEAEGMFQEAGLNVQLIPFDGAIQMSTALQGGEIDGKITDMIVVGLLKNGGTDVKVVSVGQGGTIKEGRFAFLSSPNSGITDINQLAGASIGISENTIIEYMTDEIMDYYNIDKNSVSKQVISQLPVRMEALLADKLSAALFPDPLATFLEFQGAHVIADVTKIDQKLMKTVFVFREDSINAKSDAIKKLLVSYEKAGKLLTDNPEAYRELLTEKARVPDPIKASYKPATFSPLQLPGQEEFDRVMDWMVAKELLKKPFTFDELMTDKFVK